MCNKKPNFAPPYHKCYINGYMKQRNTIFYHICALATVAAWGVSFICTRVLLDHSLTPIVIYIYRFSLAYIAMLMLSKFKIHFLRAADEL